MLKILFNKKDFPAWILMTFISCIFYTLSCLPREMREAKRTIELLLLALLLVWFAVRCRQHKLNVYELIIGIMAFLTAGIYMFNTIVR